jgi:hypothetical protein
MHAVFLIKKPDFKDEIWLFLKIKFILYFLTILPLKTTLLPLEIV